MKYLKPEYKGLFFQKPTRRLFQVKKRPKNGNRKAWLLSTAEDAPEKGYF